MNTDDARESFYRCEDYFFRSISKDCLDFEGEGTAYFTGSSSEYLNPFFLRNNRSSLGSILEKAKAFYAVHNCPWVIIIPEDSVSENHEKILRSFNFHLNEKSVAMGISLDENTKFEMCQSSMIKPVNHNLKDWMIPLVDAFGSTLELSQQYTEAHVRALLKAQFYHFTIYEGDRAAASLTLSLNQNGACLNDVGTLPLFQRQGFASRLIIHALLEARKLGATQCFLEASDEGFSLYKKLGFTPLFKNNIYLEEG